MTVTPSALDPKYQQAADRLDTAAQQQMGWSRPNTANPWAAQTNNPDGSVGLGFNGPMAGAQQNLTAQALRELGNPADYSQFNVASGDDFRQQGIDAAQSQLNDWLAPLQGGFDDADRARLLNAGYAEGSPEFQAEIAKTQDTARDFRSTLDNAAIGLGGEMGAKMGAMDLLSKQQGLAEALRKRSLPMEQLSSMQGLLGQPGVSQDDSIIQGAGMDLEQGLNNYWRQRGMAEQEQAQRDQALLGVFGSAVSMVPTAVGLGKTGFGAPKAGGAPKRFV